MINKRPSEKDFNDFALQVSRLETMEFLGLVKIMNIEIFSDDEKKTPRKFETIFSEVLDKYISLPRKKRREIMKILKAANNKKEGLNDKD